MATYYARANGNVNATNVWSTTQNGATSDLFPSFTNADTLMANGFTITLNVNTTVLEVRTDTTGGATTGGGFTLNNGITLNANCYGGGSTCVTFSLNSPNSATINGNLFGSSTVGVHGAQLTGTGTLNINGNLTAGSVLNAYGVFCSSTGTVNIVGNLTGGSVNNNNGIFVNNACTVNITGNVTGGAGSNSYGAACGGASTFNITGIVTGGTNLSNLPYGLSLTGNGVVNIFGIAIGGSAVIGAINNGNGTLNVTRAKGNGFGNGSVGLSSAVGVAGNQGGLTRVYEIEYGDLGQSPTSGPVFLFPSTSNVALFYRPNTTKKTLVDATSSSGLLPNASDVRSGISYNAGNNVGTMGVPGAASVASGVAVDNTTGTAILTTGNIPDIWNYPTSGISVSNSIGERLKNCSTVATMGQQLAASVSNIN